MKTNKFQKFMRAFLLLGAFAMVTLVSCEKDDPEPEKPIASFQYAVSATNFLEVTFTNFSQNATSYSWDFGDGGSSTDANPVYTYAEVGSYTVVLTAKNSANVSATFSQDITITDPDLAYKLLTGEVSKTWKLFREGVSMSLGPDATNPGGWWAGLENDGARPCLYYQEFTFHFDGTYVFDDKGMFWGEYGVFNGLWNYEICFEAIAANMINKDGADVSAWLSGTHAFTYDPTAGTATLNGEGAWIGIPKLGTTGETAVPASSVTFNVDITEHTGYDLMTVTFNWGEAGLWTIVYVSYSDPALEPDVVTEEEPFGEDLEDITPNPNDMFLTFVSKEAAEMGLIDTIASGSSVEFGVVDPADAGALVGEFTRTADVQYQELKFQVSPDAKDIQFDNLTSAKIDVYFPSSNDYSTLTKSFVFGFADASETEEWWTDIVQFEVAAEEITLDEWKTFTFDLTDAKARADLDMIYLGMGGGGHTAGGTFYIRNLVFE